MNVRYEPETGPGTALPVEAFLSWVERQDGKYEYDRGTIGMMVENTRDHAVLVSRFVFAFMTRLNTAIIDVVAEGFGVRAGCSVRYPDVLIQRTSSDGKSRRSDEPLVIVEVLSPSSRHLDLFVKRDEYAALPTLQSYVVASQDEPRLSIWTREETGKMPEHPVEIVGVSSALELPGLGLTIPLLELYHGTK